MEKELPANNRTFLIHFVELQTFPRIRLPHALIDLPVSRKTALSLLPSINQLGSPLCLFRKYHGKSIKAIFVLKCCSVEKVGWFLIGTPMDFRSRVRSLLFGCVWYSCFASWCLHSRQELLKKILFTSRCRILWLWYPEERWNVVFCSYFSALQRWYRRY